MTNWIKHSIKKNLSNDDLEICTVKLLNDVLLSDFETGKQLLDDISVLP